MAFLDKARRLFNYSPSTGTGFPDFLGSSSPMASVFSDPSHLAPVIAKDLGLPYADGVTLLEAYRVPPVQKALSLLTTAAVQAKWKRADGGPVAGWLTAAPEGAPTPTHRLADLVADLVMWADGCWWAPLVDGKRAGALHLPRHMWQLNEAGAVVIGGQVMPAADFVYFRALRPMGLLIGAADAINNYADIQRTIRSRGRNPIPLVELKVTEDFVGTKEELERARDNWASARQSENGAVAVSPHGVDVKIHSAGGGEEMLISARNSVRLDVANLTNLPASLLEGNSGVSGTYENTLQSRDEFVTLSLHEWLAPIAARISQLEGTEYTFDTSALSPVDAAGNVGTATPDTERPREDTE